MRKFLVFIILYHNRGIGQLAALTNRVPHSQIIIGHSMQKHL